jgi:hypothetical protein
MKRNEFINWRTHSTLNDVTKMSIEYFEQGYDFDHYLDDRSKKDTKFINPLNEDEEEERKNGDKEDRDNESDFSFSDEDEEMSQNGEPVEEWNR